MNFKSPKENKKKSVDYPIIVTVINSKPYTAELIQLNSGMINLAFDYMNQASRY